MALSPPEFYAREYFYSHSQRGRVSGYPDYTRSSSQADVACYLVWKYFDVSRVLEIGCALGFLVEALRQCGLDAKGVDVSRFAVENCCPVLEPMSSGATLPRACRSKLNPRN